MNNDVSFLKEVSSDLLSKYGNAISDFCIVIPSNRGALHFKQCLHSHIGKAFLSPDVFAIEEFTQKIAGLSLISQEELLIRFYKINQQQKIIYHQEFHEFVGDAKTILQDFNDIDLALAEAKNIFSGKWECNIQSIPKIYRTFRTRNVFLLLFYKP
jgi:ATP-dependent helicase/nuclease subunit B